MTAIQEAFDSARHAAFLTNTKRSRPYLRASSVADFEVKLEAKDANDYRECGTYWRNGFPSLAAAENHFAELAGATKEFVLLTNSGMSALTIAVEATFPTKGDVIVYGEQGYRNSLVYCGQFMDWRGVQPVQVNPGSLEDIEQKLNHVEKNLLADGKLKAVVIEPWANGPEMPGLYVPAFLSLPVLQRLKPAIVLDNTLATNSILPLAEIARDFPQLTIIGIESMTKAYVSNEDNAGGIFTRSSDLAEVMLWVRKVYGQNAGSSLVKTIEYFIPPSREQFDWENRTTALNTLMLAQGCSQASGVGDVIDVVHPGLENHPNHELAKRTAPPYGAVVPVFYIVPKRESLTAKEVALRLESSGALKDCDIAESFGFVNTTISYEPHANYVRIAGGLETPQKAMNIAEQFKQALSTL